MRQLALPLLIGLAVAPSLQADDALELFQPVATILQRRCLSCHNDTDHKGGLSLTTAEHALAGGESGPAIVPQKPDESLLLEQITVSGGKAEMPKDADPLTPAEIAAIKAWIVAGAKWPADKKLTEARVADTNWWSLQPIVRPEVPNITAADSAWVRTPIDAFVVHKLRQQDLAPSPEADRRTLARRLYFDLIGLPPTPQEVDGFVADNDPLAYEKLVDRLLESPRYGERWARHWLDVVHYGDTHGYDKDKLRPHAWPYRDYVIRALNADKPYGDFVREQLAGDVLRPGDPEGIIATGFVVAGPWDFVGHVELREGTVDKLIARNLDRDDMVMNAMTTFTSLTVHCARCHNHKFDPITQSDYYSLQAVFAGVERANRPYDPPDVARRRQELGEQRVALEAQQKSIDEQIRQLKHPELAPLDARLAKLNEQHAALPPVAEVAGRTLGYHSSIMPSADATKWVQVDLGEPRPIDSLVLVPSHVVYGGHPGPGFGFPPRFKVEATNDAAFAKDIVVLADHTSADVLHPGGSPTTIVPTQRTTARYVRITATKLRNRTNDYIFALSELVVISEGKNVAAGGEVTSLDSIEAGGGWGRKYLVDGFAGLGRLETIDPNATVNLTALLGPRLAFEAERRQLSGEREQLIERLLDDAKRRERADVARSLADTQKALAALPAQPVVYAATNPNDQPRPIHVLKRGSVQDPQEAIGPGTVSCVSGLPSRFVLESAGEGERRAALAAWVVDRGNPLTWRSIVNRIWHYHFGRGIVDSPNDFGRMGSMPTHPELLDWLAVEFRDGGQSFKKLHKLIATSAVYRQSSASNDGAAKLDSANQFLWRMNRQRLEAEVIRDAVLAVSGKLDTRMYGPGYVTFALKDDHSPHYLYEQHDPDDPNSWRRSVYRFIVRSVPDPFMETLDCADPSVNVPVRNQTLTALQALALLNNKFMIRQAEHFAAQLPGQGGELRAQVIAAHRAALARPPGDDELELLLKYAEQHGLANTCRLIFNSNEFVFVD